MKPRELQFAVEAEDDLLRLYEFLLEKDLKTAESALQQMRRALIAAAEFPFSHRKAAKGSIRECVIPFGRAGYVAAFEIADDHVLVLAVRHQREDDFY